MSDVIYETAEQARLARGQAIGCAQITKQELLDKLEAFLHTTFYEVRALHTSPLGNCDYGNADFYVDAQEILSAVTKEVV